MGVDVRKLDESLSDVRRAMAPFRFAGDTCFFFHNRMSFMFMPLGDRGLRLERPFEIGDYVVSKDFFDDTDRSVVWSTRTSFLFTGTRFHHTAYLSESVFNNSVVTALSGWKHELTSDDSGAFGEKFKTQFGEVAMFTSSMFATMDVVVSSPGKDIELGTLVVRISLSGEVTHGVKVRESSKLLECVSRW